MKGWNIVTPICVSFILITSCFSAHSANRANSVTATVGAGNFYFSSKRHLDNAAFPYVALGYNFTDQWGIEGLFALFYPDLNRVEDDGKQSNGTLAAVDVLYHFSPYKIMQPFVLAGVGALGLNPNGNDANNQGNINAGIGAQFFADSAAAFRVEARDFYTISGGKNDVMLDIGATFFWDLC